MLLPLTAARSSIFLSTPSARRATHPALRRHRILRISIHALREEGDLLTCCSRSSRQCISIHALREEGDAKATEIEVEILNFYPRPPRGGRRVSGCEHHNLGRFLSTPSARRATFQCSQSSRLGTNFYPRPPRGGRHRSATHPRTRCQFLSTPSARRATSAVNSTRHTDRFLSTPSARRATYQPIVGKGFKNISIHALREEGDSTPTSQTALLVYFYPRPPRGGRLASSLS